jgi:hypothetical protein
MIVHNISDRPNSDGLPRAIYVGKTLIRPGKFADVPEALLTPKVRKLHGKYLWIGSTLPAMFTSTSKSALKALESGVDAMSLQEARDYLATMERDDLLELCSMITPPLQFERPPGAAMLSILLSRALFRDGVDVNPGAFFWLRRWKRVGDDFEEIG